MYVKQNGKDVTILLVWVDDIIVASTTRSMLEEGKTMLSKRFQMKDMGVISHFLGIDCKVEDGKISMNQEMYIRKVLQRFNMMECKQKSFPSE